LAGIYIHIPYCKSICHYCDFYKTANFKSVEIYLKALELEIDYRKDAIDEKIQTIYFGGGTPSILSAKQLEAILVKIYTFYSVSPDCELSFEANPDDLSLNYLRDIYSVGINRLSIGVQTFDNSLLKFLNRRHNMQTSITAVDNAHKAGFRNISIDLIYGIPGQTIHGFKSDLEKVNSIQVQHLSAYHLGIEDNSYFGKLKKLGRYSEPDEQLSIEFFEALANWTAESGFEHYEISNLAKDRFYSQHNTSYWFSVPYIGIGASAHSFYDRKRFYHPSNVNTYIKNMQTGNFGQEVDLLTKNSIINEHIMLRLRTKWGIDILFIQSMLTSVDFKKWMRRIDTLTDNGYLRMLEHRVFLKKEAFMVSDYIIGELLVVD
jgi:oxygen-independent coproporphyrinogen III oxidase